MKKVLSIALALAVMAYTGVCAFATDITSVPDDDTCDVDVIVDDGDIDAVYKVVIEWDSLDFTYTFDSDDVWDPDTHTYVNSGSSNWDKTSAEVDVTNHSNKGVSVETSIDVATKNGVTASISGGDFDLATAVGTAVSAAPANTATISISGVPTVEEDFTIGTVTVDISAVA